MLWQAKAFTVAELGMEAFRRLLNLENRGKPA
jgi:hypothetical protein